MGAGPTGRGVRLPRRARRAQLLTAALEVFVAQGYHAAAMDDIAERAGVSKPVLYQHFPGKLDLYRALVDTAANEMVRTVRAAMRSTTDNKARVHAAVQAYFDVVSSRDGAMRLVFETDTRATPEIAEIVDRATSDCIDAVTEVDLQSHPVEDLARHLVGRAVGEDLVGQRDLEVLQHRQIRQHRGVLVDDRDTQLRSCFGIQPRHDLPAHRDDARVGGDSAGGDAHQRRLACA